MSKPDHLSIQSEPENESRDVSIGGNVEESAIVIDGNNNIITVNRVPAASLVPAEGEQKPLRVLTIVARPLDANELPEIADAWSLADGLLAVEAPVEVRFLRPPTVEQFQAEIDAGWDILHFDGHGTAEEGGFLLFEEENGLGKLLPTESFIEMLKRAGKPPKLLILSACQSAKPFEDTQGKGNDGGLASRVAKEAHVPAVLGFSETVPVNITMALVKRLYAGLGAGRTILASFEAATSSLGDALITLPPEKENEPERKVRAADLPILLGDGIQQVLCEPKRGKAIVERDPLVGVPSPSESGRFYGVFDSRTKPPSGRKALLAQTAAALLAGQKFVVLTGVGGIGKTALAAALARRMSWRFPGGVFWVNGADYIETGMTLDDALAPFAAVFGQDFLKAPVGGKRQAVMAYFEQLESPALWIIDNAEVASDAVWRMAREVPGRSACLLTSRERPEYGGSVISVEGMAPEEGLIFLLEETMRRRVRGLTLDEETIQSFERIAGLLDGHALALMHAAALIADEGLGSAERSVKANPARGQVSRRFDFSYARLEDNERLLLHRLSAFAADFDSNAVKAVCTDPFDDKDKDLLPDWQESLRGLTRKSFVEVGEWNENYRRYRLHPVMREYVHGKAKATIALDEWRMARYFLGMVDAARDLLGDTEKALGAVAFAEHERLNLLAGQEMCVNHEKYKEAIFFAYCLDDLFERSGRWDARRRALKTGLQAAEKVEGREHAAMLNNLAVLAEQTGDYPEARKLYAQSLEIAEQLGNKPGVAITLHQLGRLAQDTGDYPEARRLYTQSLEIEEQLGNKAGVARTLHQLAILAQDTGDYPEARKLYPQSLEINEQLGDKAGAAQTLHQLGVLAQQAGDYLEARGLYTQSLEIKEQLGNKPGVAITKAQMALLEEKQANLQQALRLITEAESIFTSLGARQSEQARKVRERIEEKLKKQ